MPAINITQVLQLASGAHGRGQWGEAEKLYRQILSVDPRQADALQLLGILLHQTGRTAAGIELICRAISLHGNIAMYHGNLANIYRDTGQFPAAVESLRTACALEPNSFPLRLRLANLLNAEMNQPAAAAEAFKAALAIDPQSAEALGGMAVALHRLYEFSDALVYYRQAIAITPRDIDLLSNYALTLVSYGESEQAVQVYHDALQIAPNSALLWYNLGITERSIQHDEKASAAFEKAIEFNPADADAHANLAAMLSKNGKLQSAAEFYLKLLEQNPGAAPIHNNLGLIRLSQGRHDESITATRRAIALDADCVNAYDNLLMALHYDANDDAAQLYREHRVWAERLEKKFPARSFSNDRSPDRRLRIGYISPDFREHSVMFFLEPILANHDHRKVEVFCYANQPINDVVTARLRSHADHWRKIYFLADEAVVDLVLKDEIDILIDLALHSHANRLGVLARKPAPLQGSYLGYASTTGLQTIDFRLTDAWIDPPGISDAHHTEKLMCLPDTQWVYRPPRNVPEVSPLPAATNGYVTFGVATNLAKINTATIAMWSRTLQAVTNSRLIIKGAGLEDTATRQYFLDSFTKAGISPRQVFFEPSVPLLEYFHFLSHIDMVLDTYPFTGGTTNCHALYMGVPVITRTGNTSVSRVGASLLHNVDLTNLIADSAESFVRIVAEIARNLPRLRQIRGTLRQTMRSSPLMNEPDFVRHLETAYRNLWKQWCSEKPQNPTQAIATPRQAHQ